mgnify:CR=1 FL=1|jgi:hypothetical protein
MKTEQQLRDNTDWDFFELDINIDVEKLRTWYYEVDQKFPNLKFSFALTDYTLPNTKQSILHGGIHSFGMAWPVDQDLPIPPRYAARPDLYPETLMTEDEFGAQMKVMEKYKFGYFKELLDTLGEDTFSWSRITVHDPASKIDPHIDGARTIRLHIPIITNDEAWFGWGDKKYIFTPGKVYLINTSKEHYTVNEGNTTRAHIISHPANVSYLLKYLS